MKIWIINQNAVPPSGAGITRHFYLGQELVKRGHEVLIVASDFSHFSRSHISGSAISEPKTEVISGVNFLWIPAMGYNKSLVRRLLSTFEFARRAWTPLVQRSKLDKPDLIIGSSPQMAAANMARRLANKLKLPFVLEIRDIWPLSAQELGNFSNLNPLICYFKWIERRLYGSANLIISVLPNSKSYFSKYGVENKVSCIPNFANISASVQPPVKSPDEKFTALYLGSFGIANNIETIVHAAHLIETKLNKENIQIKLVGDGPTKKQVVDLAKNLKITNLSFGNSVPKAEVEKILDRADVFLLPLKRAKVFQYGVSPNKLFDYMLMGRPTIFAVETTDDPIRRSGGGISVSSENPMELAQAIVKVSELDQAEREAMGKKAFDYVLQHHSLAGTTDKFEEILSRALS